MRVPQPVYMSGYDLERQLGLGRDTVARLRRRGEMMDADVAIGGVLVPQGSRVSVGWLPCRVAQWGAYAGVATMDDHSLSVPSGARPAVPKVARHPDWWYATTKQFLGVRDVAALWSISVQAVKQRKVSPGDAAHADRTGRLPDVDCQIGTVYKGVVLGWELNNAVIFGRRAGFTLNMALVEQLSS